MQEFSYYHSPLGGLEIVTGDNVIQSLRFTKLCQVSNIEDLSDISRLCHRQLDEYFNGTRKTFALPSIVEKNEGKFHEKVWSIMKTIPYGECWSYQELAKMAGSQKAARAVGTACNRNPIAIIVPCHRVLGSSGKLVGYAGGLDKKRWLLEHEGWKAP